LYQFPQKYSVGAPDGLTNLHVSAWRGIFSDCFKKIFFEEKKPFLSAILLAAKNNMGIECFVHATVKAFLLYETARQASTVPARKLHEAIWQGTPYSLYLGVRAISLTRFVEKTCNICISK